MDDADPAQDAGLDSGREPKLLDRLCYAIRSRHYSIRTETAYLYWVRYFIRFHGRRHPAQLTKTHVESFLTHLAVRRHVAASTQSQALCALVFLYRHVLEQDMDWLTDVVRAKRPRRLPTVLTVDEVDRVLAQLDGQWWLVGSLLYGAGLRLMECLRLRVKDLDFGHRYLVVRSGKGDKDRRSVLPTRLVGPLEAHLERVRAIHATDVAEGFGSVHMPMALDRKYPNAGSECAWQWVFPARARSVDPRSGKRRRHHLGGQAMQRRMKKGSSRISGNEGGGGG